MPLSRRSSEGLFTRAGMTQNQLHHQKSHHSSGADPKIITSNHISPGLIKAKNTKLQFWDELAYILFSSKQDFIFLIEVSRTLLLFWLIKQFLQRKNKMLPLISSKNN